MQISIGRVGMVAAFFGAAVSLADGNLGTTAKAAPSGSPAPLSVVVTNAASQPVPVAGAVQVTGTAQVAGSVTVSNLPAVQNVAVTNAPAVQEIAGTVTVASPEPRWGQALVQSLNGTVHVEHIPVDVRLTDIVATLTHTGSGGGTCIVVLNEYRADNTHARYMLAYAMSHESKQSFDTHWNTGIAANNGNHFGLAINGGNCGVDLIWSGTTR